MAIPVRIEVRVAFSDGSTHEYEVRSPLADQLAGLIPAVEASPDAMRQPPKLPATEWGGISIRTDDMPEGFPVTGRDGAGAPTPTVRELAAILRALPEEMQDWPVTRYCEEGVWGLQDKTGYEHEGGRDDYTPHIAMW